LNAFKFVLDAGGARRYFLNAFNLNVFKKRRAPMRDYLVSVYAVYGATSLVLTIWLARTLSRNGAVFLEEVFTDHPRLADAVNHLLVVGFYLLNFGYACLILKAPASTTPVAAVETLAAKLGLLLLSLGAMHFFNLYLFYRIRRRAKASATLPPVAPAMSLGPL
jgi:hypothetical protein